MSRYVIRRLLILIPVFLGITLLNFFLTSLLPGDAVDSMIDPREIRTLTPEAIEARRASLGLDKPWPVRYGVWLGQLAQGNLGYSYVSGEPVLAKIMSRVPPTLRLTVVSFTLAVVLGIALGVFSALRQYSLLDYLFTLLTYLNISIPGFFLALILIYVFAVQLRWFPTSGIRDFTSAGGGFFSELRYLVLPATTLALGSWATLMRYCRTSVLEILHQEYLTTARAKGLPEQIVIVRHALRNALLPLITIIGLSVPALIAGSVLIEAVFDWPGMGYLSITSIGQRDTPVIMGVATIFSLVILLTNLLTDLTYAVADPRIRYD